MARQHKLGQFVPFYQKEVLVVAVEDSKRRIILYITVTRDTMNTNKQRQTTDMLKDKQCIQQIT